MYSFEGSHLGWFENGWVFDLHGCRVFFSENATGGPMKPVKNVKPVKGVKEVKRTRAVKNLSWSTASAVVFLIIDKKGNVICTC